MINIVVSVDRELIGVNNMNKYQEALDYLVSNGTHETLYSWGDEIEVETEHGEESLNLLQELVDKATPMKPRYRLSGNIKCGCGLQMYEEQQDWYRYCASCGQKIDWEQ